MALLITKPLPASLTKSPSMTLPSAVHIDLPGIGNIADKRILGFHMQSSPCRQRNVGRNRNSQFGSDRNGTAVNLQLMEREPFIMATDIGDAVLLVDQADLRIQRIHNVQLALALVTVPNS